MATTLLCPPAVSSSVYPQRLHFTEAFAKLPDGLLFDVFSQASNMASPKTKLLKKRVAPLNNLGAAERYFLESLPFFKFLVQLLKHIIYSSCSSVKKWRTPRGASFVCDKPSPFASAASFALRRCSAWAHLLI